MYLHVLMPQSHCAESTAKWWRFEFDRVVILAMTMIINSNSVLMRVASAARILCTQHE